jgi:hypothetical protein
MRDCVKTAIRNVSASGKTIWPSHLKMVATPKLWIVVFSISTPQSVAVAAKATTGG